MSGGRCGTYVAPWSWQTGRRSRLSDKLPRYVASLQDIVPAKLQNSVTIVINLMTRKSEFDTAPNTAAEEEFPLHPNGVMCVLV